MFKSFLQDESGAQVVEYALIIAIISIALLVALQPATIASDLDSFIDRVAACLGAGPCL